MTVPITDLASLLKSMEPVQNPGIYVFTMFPAGLVIDPGDIVAQVQEPEGTSAVVAEETATRLGLPILFRAAWITLKVHSDLQAVGLTAAFSTALAHAGISCNVIAGARHDHIFVPHGQADAAMTVLRQLQRASA